MATYYACNTYDSTGGTWYKWQDNTTTTATGSATTTWRTWVYAGATGTTGAATSGYTPRREYQGVAPIRAAPSRTPEQERLFQLEMDRINTEVEHLRARNREAHERAALLLHSHLTESQRASVATRGCFRVTGPSGVVYEVDTNRKMHNVFELDSSGHRVAELCVYAGGDVPLPDSVLTQKLHLECDEAALRSAANRRVLIA